MPLDSDRSLTSHVEALYVLARVLAGTDEATALVRTVYEHAAEVPPQQRPSDERAWLFRLMVKAQEGTLHPAGAEVHPKGETSFTDDPFRREVANQTAARKLPAAFAACSIHERFILAIDALGNPPDNVLGAALDTTVTNARSVRDQARSALRASLRDVLKGPERMLVDVALPDAAVREHLRDLLLDRFHPTPDHLHPTVTDVLEQARAERANASTPDDSSPSILSPVRSVFQQVFATIRDWGSLRGLLGGLVFLVVVTAGVGGANHLFSSSPNSSSPPGLIELSVQRADDVSESLQTTEPVEAAAYVRRTWDRRVSVPSVADASLTGVGRLSLSMGVDVPVFLYTDETDGTEIVAFVYNYALLDQIGSRAPLDRERRTDLAANDALLTEQAGDQAVVLWRQRDDVLLVIAPHANVDSLRSRIRL